jgi:hypothetical protein
MTDNDVRDNDQGDERRAVRFRDPDEPFGHWGSQPFDVSTDEMQRTIRRGYTRLPYRGHTIKLCDRVYLLQGVAYAMLERVLNRINLHESKEVNYGLDSRG